jgi:hypothetical protein
MTSPASAQLLVAKVTGFSTDRLRNADGFPFCGCIGFYLLGPPVPAVEDARPPLFESAGFPTLAVSSSRAELTCGGYLCTATSVQLTFLVLFQSLFYVTLSRPPQESYTREHYSAHSGGPALAVTRV